jgi:Holliday junction resolvasome RuvABC endonuclease subunit
MAAAELVVRAIDEAISNNDAAALLRWYDNKGVMAIAAKTKGVNVPRFKQWLVRSLANGSAPAMAAAVQALLPELSPA